jgi:YidC/Oxa1 family membrane protein insertase
MNPVLAVSLGSLAGGLARYYLTGAMTRFFGNAFPFGTLFVNLLLLPLTAKSLKSMKDLQKLQPKIQKIRQMHEKNPQKMNQEMQTLYRMHKVNPIGGCLPMVLQMPIFVALYQTLVRSIELRGAEFPWIRDLSAPDAFWRLPWGIPLIGNAINLLPLLMIAAMVWQQKLSSKASLATTSAPTSQDPQKMMATVMPIVFGLLFYNLPAGLVLYWLTNTIIMSTYQFQMMRTS